MSEDVAAPQEDGAADAQGAPAALHEASGAAAASPPAPAAAERTAPAAVPSTAACSPGGAEPATESQGAAEAGKPREQRTCAQPTDTASSSSEAPVVATAAPSGGTAATRERTQLSADAQVFVSSEQAARRQAAQQAAQEATQQAVQQAYIDDANFVASLPPAVRQQLRGCFQAPTGEIVSYYVGRLKSFNHRNGYGFIACAQATAAFGQDVFIHKNWMDHPWSIGQVVEFAVMANNKGQPQAYDACWPKQLGTPIQPRPVAEARQGFSTAGVASTGGTGDGHSAAAAMQTDGSSLAHTAARPAPAPAPPAAAAATSQARRLGVLKSFSPAQGYGFIECEEVKQSHQRDTYLDKSQLPTNMLWRHGQVLEFSVSMNARSQPQAREINWDPIPLLPTEAGAPSNATQGRSPAKPTVDKLRKLLELLHKKQHEVAVLTAIDNQGHGAGAAPPAEASTEMGIDYVTFVLDRAGDANEAVGIIKDFVKMLLLLMLARMLRAQQDQRRCHQLLRWFHALTDSPVSSLDSAFAKLQRMANELTAEALPTTA